MIDRMDARPPRGLHVRHVDLVHVPWAFPSRLTIGGIGVLFGLIGIGLDEFRWARFATIPSRIYGTVASQVLDGDTDVCVYGGGA